MWKKKKIKKRKYIFKVLVAKFGEIVKMLKYIYLFAKKGKKKWEFETMKFKGPVAKPTRENVIMCKIWVY